MAIVLNGTTGITAPDISVTAQSTDITTTGDITAVDATLSGGVYLGGTGSANYLDDYEEGTFTPSISFNGGTTGLIYNDRGATYIKSGNVVTVWIYIALSNKGSSTGHVRIEGLPFACSGLAKDVFAPMGDRGRVNTSGRGVSVYIFNGSYFLLYSGGFDGSGNSSVNNSHLLNNTELDLQFSYPTS